MEDKCIVEFFYDFVSPYSYIAFVLFMKCKRSWTNMKLQLKPTRVRDVISMSGNSSPGSVPAKREYIYEDLGRLSKYYDIPFVMPQDARRVIYEKGSIHALSVVNVLKAKFPDYVESVSKELFRRVWVTDDDITTSESLKDTLQAVEFPVEYIVSVLNQADSDESKKTIAKEATLAVEHGLFGMPSILYQYMADSNKELLFGTDRIFLLAHLLGQEWPPKSS